MADYKSVIKELKSGKYEPIYFLYGEESYFIDQISDYIEENALDESERDFNQTILYGKDVDEQTVVATAKRFPMMSERNVVIVKEAQYLKKLEEFESYIDNPLPSTVLVLCYKHKGPDGRKAVTKKLKSKTVFVESKKLYDNQVPQWIDGYVKLKGGKIDPKATYLLAEYLGTDLQKISNEIDKLFISIDKSKEISTKDIEENIGISKDYNVFELNTAIGQMDIDKANRIVFNMASNEKDNPIQLVVGAVFGYFTKLLHLHTNKNKDQKELARIMGVHPFFMKEYQFAAKYYPIKRIVKVIDILKEYDLKSKGVGNSSTSSGELMKEMVFKIMH